MVKSFSVVLIAIVGYTFLSSCTDNEDNEIIYDSGWSYEKRIAMNLSTFDIPAYRLRIPFCEITNNGTLIVGSDIRENSTSDLTRISIGIIRYNCLNDYFSNAQIIIPHTNECEYDRAMDGTILVDRNTGRIFVFAHRIISNNVWEEKHSSGDYGFSCEYVYSDDDGITWSVPQKLQNILKSDLTHVVSLFGGVGHGITMDDGTLVLPIQCKMAVQDNSSAYNIQSGIIYSKDHGQTWYTSKSLVPCYSSENMVVEYEQGKLMINCKSYVGLRRVYITSNMGESWSEHSSDLTLVEPFACQGSFHKFENSGFFINPMDSQVRRNITLQVSDDFMNWQPVLQLEKGRTFGYSCLCSNNHELYAVTETTGDNILLYKLKYK